MRGHKGKRAQGWEGARAGGHKGKSTQEKEGTRAGVFKGGRAKGCKAQYKSIWERAIRAGRYKIGGKMVQGLNGARERGHKGGKV